MVVLRASHTEQPNTEVIAQLNGLLGMVEVPFSDELRKWALAPLSTPPNRQKSRGKIICNCYDVSENEIIETCEIGADLQTLQAKLKCGTECGSYVPELKRLVKTHSTNS
jgi:assimilatory nitrate reductase catalytic subunit